MPMQNGQMVFYMHSTLNNFFSFFLKIMQKSSSNLDVKSGNITLI